MFTTVFSGMFTYLYLYLPCLYLCLLVFTYVHPCLLLFTTSLPMFTPVYSCLPMFALVNLCWPLFTHVCLLMFTHVYSCLPMFTLLYLCLHLFTRACLCSLVLIVHFSCVGTGNRLAVNVIWHQWDHIAYACTYAKVGGHDNALFTVNINVSHYQRSCNCYKFLFNLIYHLN